MTPEQWTAVFTAATVLLSVAAATVSAVAAVMAVRSQRWAQKPHVGVRHLEGFPAYFGENLGPAVFMVEVVNAGFLPLVVTSAGILIGDGQIPYMIPASWGDALPKPLGPGEMARLVFGTMEKLAGAVAESHQTPRRVTVSTTLGTFDGPPIKASWLARYAVGGSKSAEK